MVEQEKDRHVEEIDRVEVITYVDLIRIAWRRRSLVALGVVAALVLGSLYFAQTAPIYEANAEILVVKKRPEVVTGEQIHMSHFEDFVSTHTVLIKSPLIIERAIKAANLRSLQTFADDEEDLTDVIIDKLSVGRGSKELGKSADSILTLSFRGPVSHECATVVQAILDSYQEFLDETYRNMGEDTIALIEKAREVLRTDLQQQEEAYREFRQRSPLVSQGTDEVNPRQDRLAAIESQLSELLLRRADFEAQLETIQSATKVGRSRGELVALVSDLANRTETNYGVRNVALTLDSELFSLLQAERKLRNRYGPNHPHVQSVRQRIEATREFFALPNAAYNPATKPNKEEDDSQSSDPVRLYNRYLEQELDRVRISEQLLSTLYDREHEAAKQLTTFELQDEEFNRNISRTQKLYDGVVSQLQGASLVKDYGGFDARIIAPARIGEKVWPNALIVFPGAVFLGTVFGLCLVYLAEVTDKSLRTPEEIRRHIGYPLIGHVPAFAPVEPAPQESGRGSLDPMLYAYHKPGSVETEAYRGVRTALYFSTRGQAHKIIQVTSASPGDGKSTLASNLAVCIAQSGKKVLLIDADLRKPKQHVIFAVHSRTGLASVIGLDEELVDSIQESPVANLWILPSGELPPNPSELLTSHRFSELLESVREKYDYVLVDSGPLLAVTDPSVVAPRVDGVLVTLRLSKNGRTDAIRTKEILGDLDANVLGVVVNGVTTATSRSYGYGQHGFSRYYGADGSDNGRNKRRSKLRAK
jgi:succinoglycan biosynthesis transport protein ExoP